ncbi:hypothetical protein [Gluconobacter cerinus]|uniref:hypothetical protein n=1 Tax=Gluconobacter cerinus TaxID=38307 RepID=UPI0024E0C364|nr:hypothetical protein [Gluconobacter cerinus]
MEKLRQAAAPGAARGQTGGPENRISAGRERRQASRISSGSEGTKAQADLLTLALGQAGQRVTVVGRPFPCLRRHAPPGLRIAAMQTHQTRLVIVGSAAFEDRPALVVGLFEVESVRLCGAFEGL